jgi:CRISPR-associated protein Cmr3
VTDTRTRWVAFTPRDTVVVRDGRSFDAGSGDASSHRAQGVAPWPSTLAGALTTALADPDDGTFVEPAAVRGPVLAKWDDTVGWKPYFPVPADVYALPGSPGSNRSVSRLTLSTWGAGVVQNDLDGGPERLLMSATGAERHEPLAGLVTREALSSYLAGALPAAQTHALGLVERSPLHAEPRVGLAREGRAAKEGFLYAMTHLRLDDQEGWALLAEVADTAATARRQTRGPVPLGGRSRIADVDDAPGMSWPDPPAAFPGGRVLVYLATPALWPGGWRPPLPAGVHLIAAATGRPLPVPTASPRIARRDRTSLLDTVSLRWAVPAGAVYLLQFTGDGEQPATDARTWALRVHGRSLGPGFGGAVAGQADATASASGEPGTDRTSTAGFGVVLTGAWNDPADQ